MRQKLFIILTILGVVVLLIALNAATYVAEEKKPESELSPNRSTYHAGPTGTRALYDFLSESGYPVMRWREPPSHLLTISGQQVQTFVVVGTTQLPFDEGQASSLLEWVENGGRLVLVDRFPQTELLPQSDAWKLETQFTGSFSFDIDPTSPEEMTRGVKPAEPVQPTLLTRSVSSVMPSRLASRIKIFAYPKWAQDRAVNSDEEPDDEFPPPAPVANMADSEGPVLVDYSHGYGRIVLLSDPFIVANNGISRSDNLQLALNLVGAGGGLIAFDEYHQGHGDSENALIAYFSGTPVLAICGQICFLILLLLWTSGRRFARPLPLEQIDRRSKLEFVASMAELQERSRAFDLAIENIYTRTRRVLARYAGVEYNRPRAEIAALVASRSNLDRHKLETLMRQCEETINGAHVNWRQSIDMVKRLREVERALGLQMRSRDVRQAAKSV